MLLLAVIGGGMGITVVSLFSGGGGVEAGLVDAVGEFQGYGVEFNPRHPKESAAIADCYESNFPTHKLFRRTVQDMADCEFDGIHKKPDVLWASPECVFSSQLKAGQPVDYAQENAQALAVLQGVYHLQPKHFILENVPQYRKSTAFKYLICENLKVLGYQFKFRSVRLLSHQSRDRLILWASKSELFPAPEDAIPGGWWWKVANLVEDLPSTELSKSQQHHGFVDAPTWLNCVGRTAKPVPGNKPVGTITRSLFTDQKGSSRNRFASIILPDGEVKQASIECIKRLQGFPNWYKLPEKTAITGAILGNSVPPEFIARWLGSADALRILGVSHKENSIDQFLCDTPKSRVASGWISYDQVKDRYLYNYREWKEGKWKSKCKHVKKHLVEVVLEARSLHKPVEYILRLI